MGSGGGVYRQRRRGRRDGHEDGGGGGGGWEGEMEEGNQEGEQGASAVEEGDDDGGMMGGGGMRRVGGSSIKEPRRRGVQRAPTGGEANARLLAAAMLVAAICLLPATLGVGDDELFLSFGNSSQCPIVVVNNTTRTVGVEGVNATNVTSVLTRYENFEGMVIAVILNSTTFNGTNFYFPSDSYRDNTTNMTSNRFSVLNASCSCANGTVRVNKTRMSEVFVEQLSTSDFSRRRLHVEGGLAKTTTHAAATERRGDQTAAAGGGEGSVDAVDFGNGGSKKLVLRSGGGSRGQTSRRREGGDGSTDDTTDPTGGGGVDSNGNETAGGPLRKIENSTCMSMFDINRMCKFGLISRYSCELLGFMRTNGTASKPNIVYVENVVTIVTNITKQVNINQTTESGNVLQREIDAFLASFRNPTTYFYQSNLGVGEVANVMLWAGFLFFCLVSIILHWLSSRTKKSSAMLPIMLHTLSTTFTMLGYLVMAFGHGRSYDSEVIFGSSRNATSGGLFFAGRVLYVPHVPPFFYARYIMWMSSTTSTLYLICTHAGLAFPFIFRVLALNISMLSCGLFASSASTSDLYTVTRIKWVFYTLGCLFFSLLFIQLAFTVRRSASKIGTLWSYDRLVAFIFIFWPLYPIHWLISSKGLYAIPTDVEVILWVFLDIVCKLGFILLYQYLMYIKQKERRAAAVKKPSEGTFSGDSDGRSNRTKGFIPRGVYGKSSPAKDKEAGFGRSSSNVADGELSGANIISKARRFGRVLSGFAMTATTRQTREVPADVNMTYGRKPVNRQAGGGAPEADQV